MIVLLLVVSSGQTTAGAETHRYAVVSGRGSGSGASGTWSSVGGMSETSELTPRPFSAAPGEVEALLGALYRNRRTFAWKTGGLDADAMRRTLGPSTLTLGGLVKHLALVEDHYFTHLLLGDDYPAVWAPMATDGDWPWTSAADDSPAELRALWLAAVARSEAAVDRVLAEADLDRALALSDGPETLNLRRVLVDLIEEYARHTGHADLIRESIDGLVGEDAPH
jgi:uncharacterized damage-inducible protein DinB